MCVYIQVQIYFEKLNIYNKKEKSYSAYCGEGLESLFD